MKVDLFREIHIPQAECSPSQKVRGPRAVGVVSFYGSGNFMSGRIMPIIIASFSLSTK